MHTVRGGNRHFTPLKDSPVRKKDPEMEEIMKMIGTSIHEKYRITDFLGKGGMGVVYLAKLLKDDENNGLKKGDEAAIKIISAKITDARMIERFNREVKATVMIDHPNVIDVYEVNTFGNRKFCAMEVLRGVDLEKVLRKDGPLQWDKLKGIMLQVCAGVSAAHAETDYKPPIIHRDLKPSNIILIRNGEEDLVKVLDFGLAKFMEDQPSELTQEGYIVGTPEYLAPEQTFGKHDYDHRVDVYAVCVVMYKMLTGRVPFKDDDIHEMVRMIRVEPPKRPSELNPDVPPEVERIILKGLSKDPRQRYQNMDELIEAIGSTGGPVKYKGSVVSDDLLLDLVRDSAVPKTPTPDGDLGLDPSIARQLETPGSSFDETEVLSLGPVKQVKPRKRRSGAFGKLVKAALVTGALAGIGYAGYRYRDLYMPYVERSMDNQRQTSAPPRPSAGAPEVEGSYMASISGTPGAFVYEVPSPGSRERIHLGNIPSRGGSFNYRFSGGEHILVIAKQGHAPETIRVSEGNATRTVSLSPRRGVARPRAQEGPVEGDPDTQDQE